MPGPRRVEPNNTRPYLLTYQDLIDQTLLYLGANPTEEASRIARQAVQNAMENLINQHEWSYFFTRGRMNTVASYSTGTIAYDHTGGAYERLVTLTDGTWPSWIADGVLQISNVPYEVQERRSDTLIVLKSTSNPAADVASGTTYLAFQDSYPLPVDFLSIGELQIPDLADHLTWESPATWLRRQRLYRGPATPRMYTVLGSADNINTLILGLYPAPDAIYNLDFLYRRRHRTPRLNSYTEGSISTTADSATITGTGTAWTSSMVGMVLRLTSSKTTVPSAAWDVNPATHEKIITEVASATSLTVDTAVTETLSGVKYRISDLVDIDRPVLGNALTRGCELEVGNLRSKAGQQAKIADYRQAVLQAMERDSRYHGPATAGMPSLYPTRIANYPTRADR